ncbi:MAG: ABC transporter substrate-binding protein [Rhodobiaceae bacterium]|nr:ABC transporter substrate-binding protein [Rhodobiaceae bacterium]
MSWRLFTRAFAAGIAIAMSVAAANAEKIRVANLEIGAFLPIPYTAKIAAKHGIEIELVNFRRGLEAANALKAGEVDIAVGGIEAAISAIGAGAPAVVVASCTTGGVAWVAGKDSPVNSIQDLKGHKFAVIRGLHELIMRVEFEQHNLTMSAEPGEADIHVVYINSPPALNVALKAGEVDAMSAPEPFPSRAISEGYAKPLLLPYDTPLGDVPRAVFMRKDFLAAHPDEAQKFVDALVDATKQLRDDPSLAKDFALNDALRDAMTEADWDLTIQNLKFNVSLDAAEVEHYIDYMTKYGMLKTAITASDVASLDMLEKAKAEYGW